MGGPEKFIKRLDHYFEKGYHDIGNEPGMSNECLLQYIWLANR